MADAPITPVAPPTAAELTQAIAGVIPPVAATKLRYEVGPNTVFEGDTPEEVIEKMVKAQQSANGYIDTLKSENQSLRATQQPRDDQGRFTTPEPAPTGAFSQDEYFKLFTESPDKAQAYLLENKPEVLTGAIGKLFGIDSAQVVPTFSATIQSAQEQRDQAVSEQFLVKCPDFPVGDPKASQALVDHLQVMGSNINPDSLAAAHYYCVATKVYEPRVQETAAGITATPLPVTPGVGGGGAAMTEQDIVAMSERMSTEEIRKAMKAIYESTKR